MSAPDPVQVGYDAVYDAMLASPTFRQLWREHAAGIDFPDSLSHISFVTLKELHRIADYLNLAPGKTLVDLGCGLAGPSLWVARETGATLVGVDLSIVAPVKATARAESLGLAHQATFKTGSFAETGLAAGSADAIMSEDALQYAPDKRAAMKEAARIARPGAKFVFTVFELDPVQVAGLPVIGADPVDDYRPLLQEFGFIVESYEEVPGWPEPMRSAYSAVLAAKDQLVGEMGEAATAALSAEVVLTLERNPYKRRVLAVAKKS